MYFRAYVKVNNSVKLFCEKQVKNKEKKDRKIKCVCGHEFHESEIENIDEIYDENGDFNFYRVNCPDCYCRVLYR